MICPSCGHENRAEAKFCEECAAPLMRACDHCGAILRPTAKFCDSCAAPVAGTPAPTPDPRAYTPRHLAEKILGSRATLEGERKHVTVLFADVKGSMDLAEELGPEEWRRLLDEFFAILTEGVHRFEGTVNQYTGDGIMALFGAPIAHEDHAQRACWAALHLRDALRRYADRVRVKRGLSFSTRIGLNSGEVVVGKIGDDLRMDYAAQGHTVGLAQRMEALAEPGTVCLTEHTARLVGGYFQLRDLGPLVVKGVREPLRLHVLEGAGVHRTRLDVSRARGFSRFVARQEEMAVLEAALARSLDGHGQVVGVVAEPGVGKSRLCFEFAERCRARGLRVQEAHAVAHGKTVPFLTVLEYLRADYGITDRDSPLAVREKVTGRLLVLDPELADALPLFFDFLGVPDPDRPALRLDSEARQRQLFAALRRVMHAQSRREPMVAVIEDLHWNDAASEAFLAHWVEVLDGTRTLLVANFRPEYHADWMERSYYQRLSLLPLGPEASAELLRDLLGDDESLVGLPERIHRRTGGNPFFIEEMVQQLVEAGHLEGAKGAYRLVHSVTDDAMPASVQAVLAARIDRLGEREKAVLQTAAVIGKEFAEPVLRRVADLPQAELTAALAALARAELVYETALYPEAEYAFKHPLTQEVAYRSQLTERRATVHARVARTLLEVYAAKLDEKAAVLAYHFDAAGEILEAARWHARAAEWTGTSDRREALRHWERVRALGDRLPESREAGSLGLRARAGMLNCGWRIDPSSARADDLVSEGRAIAERIDDPVGLARLLMVSSTLAFVTNTGSITRSFEIVDEVQALATRTGDPLVRLGAHMGRAYFAYLDGRLSETVREHEAAEKLLPEDPWAGAELFGFVPRVWLPHITAMALVEMGRLDEARRLYERATDLARSLGALENLGWVFEDRAVLEAEAGELQQGLDIGTRGLEIAEKVGTSFGRVMARHRLAEVHIASGHYREAAEMLEVAIAMVRESRVGGGYEAQFVTALSEAFLGLGEVDRARLAAEEALAVVDRQGTRLFGIGAHLALARAALRDEALRARGVVEQTLERATSLIAAMEAWRWQPRVHLVRAELAQARGDEAGRRRELARAQHLFTAMGAPLRAEQIAQELAR
jgi:class 3 adenylate cyclase/tetratricopeptide (TPR) repeat protein